MKRLSGTVKSKDESRNIEMARYILGGETLQAVGDRFGVTREYVRQVVLRYGVTQRGGRRTRREFKLWLLTDQFLGAAAKERVCPICNKPAGFFGNARPRVTCSPVCRLEWSKHHVKLQWGNPEFRKKMYLSHANYILVNRSNMSNAQIRWAFRELGRLNEMPPITPGFEKLAAISRAHWAKKRAEQK